jgi:extracellular elastinolytic metalloproteinase
MFKHTLLMGLFAIGLTANAQNSAPTLTKAKVLQTAMGLAAAGKWGLVKDDMAAAQIQDLYRDGSGVTHAYVLQTIQGVPVMNGVMGLHFNANGDLLYSTNRAIAHATDHLVGSFNALDKDLLGAKAIEQENVLARTVISDGSNESSIFPSTAIKWLPMTIGTQFEEGKFYTQSMAWPNEKGDLIAAQYFVFYNSATSDWVNLWMDASGKTLQRHSWTVHCSPKSTLENNNSNDNANSVLEANRPLLGKSVSQHLLLTGSKPLQRRGDGATYKSFSFPTESPLYGSPTTLTSPADAQASPYGWHDVDGKAGAEYTITRGNNVYAAEDVAAKNTPGKSPDGGTSLTFNLAYDPAEPNPVNYQDFAISNLFVVNNLMHDITQHYGFDEPSGNFQKTNYDGLGAANDPVSADAQDGSGTNNANFATPPDGSAPRMQMYIWDGVGAKANLVVDSKGIKYGVGITDGNWGKKITAIPSKGKLVLVKDNVTPVTNKCCTGITNSAEIKGNFAAIVRGGCTFVQKVYRAQSNGATAAILLDTSTADAVITMATDNTSQASKVTIPVIFVRFSNANELRTFLADSSFNITFYDSSAYAKKTDSDLDLGVMGHEYTHGISTRLTCGPSNSNGLSNAEQMGEGWSDFIGLAFTAKKGDVGSKPRGVGNWLFGQDQNGDGIRTYPYTTNMSLNPHTYGNLAKASVGVQTEVHYTGEIWCTMLWDMYWGYVDKYGFDEDLYNGTGGNNRAVQVVIDAMKLQPCGPGFVDARDAILAADSIRYGGANKKIIWDAFARRGLGYSAAQGSANNCADGEEAFDLPPAPASNVNQIKQDWLKVRPNPATEVFVIEPMNVLKIESALVFDIKGGIHSVPTAPLNGGGLALDVRGLSAGIYWVQVKAGNDVTAVKLIKP